MEPIIRTETHTVSHSNLVPETVIYYSKIKSKIWIGLGIICFLLGVFIVLSDKQMAMYAIILAGTGLALPFLPLSG